MVFRMSIEESNILLDKLEGDGYIAHIVVDSDRSIGIPCCTYVVVEGKNKNE